MAEKKAFVQSVDRSLQILELFIDKPTLSLIEISDAMNLAKTTVFGLIATLEKRGFLEQNPLTGRYQLGHRLIELSSVLLHRADIINEAIRLLRPIADKNGHNAHITTRNGVYVTYVGQVVPENSAISINTIIGSQAPANCTSSGKAFLSMLSEADFDDLYAQNSPIAITPQSITSIPELKYHLYEARLRGYAIDCNESISGVSGVGTVVCNDIGTPMIGISIAGLSADFNEELISEYGKSLKYVANQLRHFTCLTSSAF